VDIWSIVLQKTDKKSAGSICLPVLLKRSGFFLSLLAVMAMAVVVVLYRHFREDLPKVLTPQDYRPALKSKVYAQDGQLIAEFGFYERVVLERDALPLLVKQAFIASEDKNFYSHHGIDFFGIINALRQSLVGNRSSLRGASTLSQQLAKGLLIKEEGYEQATARTLARKIKEAILARRLEMDLNKEDILWMYLNEVYLGHGSYGVAAASHNYFRKDLADLRLNEIAILAGLPQAPSRFSPQANMSAALARQGYVLRRMVDDGFITAPEMERALKDNQHLRVYERENRFRDAAPYFSETIRRQLVEQFGGEQVYEGGLEIFTTLDLHHEHAGCAQGWPPTDRQAPGLWWPHLYARG
jgi:penicillin-binding protein 1A